MTTELIQRILAQLGKVLDPCSCMTDTPVSIVELGLIEEIEVDGSSVEVELVPTTPMCLYMAQIVDEAEAEVMKLDEIEAVRVTQNVEELWLPERMNDELLQAKEERFGAAFQNASNAT